MTKQEFLKTVAKLYAVGNMSDSDNPARPDWVKPEMAGDACCAALDSMLHAMQLANVLTDEEVQAFYDNM